MSDDSDRSEERARADFRMRSLQGDEDVTEEELRRLVEVSQDLANITGFDGYFKLLSPSWEVELGWTREELRSRPYIEFVHPDDRDKTYVVEDRLQPGVDLWSFQNRYICKDGSVKALRWQGVTSPETRRYYMMARVVDPELQAREYAGALDAIFEISEEALIMQGEDGRITRWSVAARKAFGHYADDVAARPITEFLRTRGGKGIDLIALDEADAAKDARLPATMLHADGSRVDVLIAVRPFSDGSRPIAGAVAALTLV